MSIADHVADLRRLAGRMWTKSETADPEHARVNVATAERYAREADDLEAQADDPSPETAARIAQWDETIPPKKEEQQ